LPSKILSGLIKKIFIVLWDNFRPLPPLICLYALFIIPPPSQKVGVVKVEIKEFHIKIALKVDKK